MSSVRISLCVRRLHVCVHYVMRLGQFYERCEWDVSAFIAFCLMLLWGIVCLIEVLPDFPPCGVGKPALYPLVVSPLSAVCAEGVGSVLCGYC